MRRTSIAVLAAALFAAAAVPAFALSGELSAMQEAVNHDFAALGITQNEYDIQSLNLDQLTQVKLIAEGSGDDVAKKAQIKATLGEPAN